MLSLFVLSIILRVSYCVSYFNKSPICNVILLDESGTEYYLISTANPKYQVLVTLEPNRWPDIWSHSHWYYDVDSQRLIFERNKTLCLVGNPDLFVLYLSNCSSSNPNQRFVYNQEEKSLCWINPRDHRRHPIYLEKMHPFATRKALISKNSISRWTFDQIKRFSQKQFINASAQRILRPRSRRTRALKLYSLQRAMPNLTSIEWEKYMEMIASFTEREFGYFLNKHNGYLISDGHTVNAMKLHKFKSINYKFYGLWHVDEDNHLIHFLSGNYLKAIPNHKSIHIKLLENMLHLKGSQAKLSRIEDTFYDLKIEKYSQELEHTLVTVERIWNRGERHEIYVNNNRKYPQRVENTVIVEVADCFMVFVNRRSYEKIWNIVLGNNDSTRHSKTFVVL